MQVVSYIKFDMNTFSMRMRKIFVNCSMIQ